MSNKKIIEDLCRNSKIVGLVSMMKPVELMKALVKHKDLLPKDAAKIIFDLKKKAEGMGQSAIEPNKQFPVPPTLRGADKDDPADEIEELSVPSGKTVWGQGGGPDAIRRHHFPPDPRSTGQDFPYEDTFVNYMNGPKRKRSLTTVQMSHKDLIGKILEGEKRNLKYKPDLTPDLYQGQAGGDGAGGLGIYSKNGPHARNNRTSSQATSWDTRGDPGWAASLNDKEFEVPPKSIKKADPVEFSQPTGGGQAHRPNNAGDDDDTPSFMKDPNVAQTIWVPGRQPAHSAPYRNWRRR